MTDASPIEVRNPYTGAYDYAFTPVSAGELAAMEKRLRAAQPAWRALGGEGRASQLRAFARAAAEKQERLVNALIADTGRFGVSFMEADMTGKVERAIAGFEQFVDPLKVDETAMPGVSAYQELAPYQLVGNITPWNFPCSMAFLDTLPALLCGCAVIVKPSEIAPRFVDVFEEILDETPALKDVLAFARGDGAVGAQLIERVDFVCFTGSVETGRKVYRAAAANFIPSSMELGGKDPMIVLADADPEEAALNAMLAGCMASGQICTSLERIYAAAPVYDDFLAAAAEFADRMEINYPDPQKGYLGPFIFERQAEIVADQIEDAAAKGARIVAGGGIIRNGGVWCEPTVLADVDHSMKVMREETFGPVIPVMPFQTADEAVAFANDSRYGLTATVMGNDMETARDVAARLNAGCVGIGRAGINLMVNQIEHDAYNQSGIGPSRMGAEGFRRFYRSKAVISACGDKMTADNPMAAAALTRG